MNTIAPSGWLYGAGAFLLLAIIAAVLGFGLIADLSFTIAKWLAIIFVILFVIAIIIGLSGRTGSGRKTTH